MTSLLSRSWSWTITVFADAELVKMHHLVTQKIRMVQAPIDAPFRSYPGGAVSPDINAIAAEGEQLGAVADSGQGERIAPIEIVGHGFLRIDPLAFKRGQIGAGEHCGLARRIYVNDLQNVIRTSRTWSDGDNRRAIISINRFDLMDVCKTRRGLKAVVELECPAIHDRIAEKSPERIGGRGSGLDFIALSVEIDAAIIVGRDMDIKEKHRLVEVVVPFLGDVRAEVRMAAIRNLFGASSEGAVDQCIGVSLAIGRENGLCPERQTAEQQEKQGSLEWNSVWHREHICLPRRKYCRRFRLAQCGQPAHAASQNEQQQS